MLRKDDTGTLPGHTKRRSALLFALTIAGMLLLPKANAASCKTQSEMTVVERNALSSAARLILAQMQSGDEQALRANTIPAVAANFGGIAASASRLRPFLAHATITVNHLYALDASDEPAGTALTSFYCGSPVVALNIANIPPGKYALTILRATGVPQPYQISFILSETAPGRWMLAGFFSKPMTQAGHDGLWYWERARTYAEKGMDWNAWFYYQTAAAILDPVDFLSSPNLEELQREADKIRPGGLPGTKPLLLHASGTSFEVTSMGPTVALGKFDLEVHYTPNAAQLAQLRDPVAARKQAIDATTTLLAQHPELRSAFQGIWIRANQGSVSVYALELPMNEVSTGSQSSVEAGKIQSALESPVFPAISTNRYDPTKPEVQPHLDVDRDPVLSPDVEASPQSGAGAATGPKPAGEIQKGQSGMYTLRENVNEVLLYCSVLNEKGRLVTGLKRDDFRVWEDGIPQTIDSFQRQDVPVSMGILIDNSGSMHDKRATVESAALELVRASNPQDEAFIVNFSDKAYLDQGLTSNISALKQGLSRFDSRNTTALYDAVVASADELARHATQPKQALLIITDGADNASRLTLEQAVQRVQNLGGPVVYSIGLLYGDSKEETRQAKTSLEELSRETGGIAYFPSSLQDVNEIAEEVARDIRDQYTIGYRSTKPASIAGYRTVRVEAKARDHGRLTVRTRKGYYHKAVEHLEQAQAQP